MLNHLKYSIPDFILGLFISVGLAVNLVQSFLLPEGLSADVPRMALVAASTIFVLILLSYNKLTVILGGVLGGVALAVLIPLTVMGIIPTFAESSDAEANGSLWYLVVVLCAVLIYLLCRTRATSWVLLALGTVLSAYFLLLEYTYHVWGLVLLLWSAGTWLCFITYRRKLLRANAARTAFLPVLGHGAGVSTLCLAIGFLLWWGIIRPLQPPTKDIALWNELIQTDVVEYAGLYQPDMEYDPELTSDEKGDEKPTDEKKENENSDNQDEVEGSQDDEHSEDNSDNDTEPNDTELQDTAQQEGTAETVTFDVRSLLTLILMIVGIVLAVLLILLFFFLRRRKIWYRKVTGGLDDGAYIRFFFSWYLGRFTKVLKLPAPRGNTPLEYAAQMERATCFFEETGVTWQELSQIYHKVVYSGRNPEPEDKRKFEQFYQGFHRCCRKKLHFSWLWKSLRL